jgi:hypothetical protein
MKKILLSLCCLTLSINSSFSTNSDSNIIVIDQSKIDRKDRQLKTAIQSEMKNCSMEEQQEIYNLTASFFKNQEWDIFGLFEIFRYIVLSETPRGKPRGISLLQASLPSI